MRELMFRGQTRRYGEKIKNLAGEKMESAWAYGPGVTQGIGDFSIIYGADHPDYSDAESIFLDKHSVYTDTLGQFTGLIDKNGAKVFEGDIVKGAWGVAVEVYFDKDYLQFRAKCKTPDGHETDKDIDYFGDGSKVEVIGNIYDNPELLDEPEARNG